MGHGAGTSRLHRQGRLGSVQRLALSLFVEAEHRRPGGWIQVQPNNIDEFVLGFRIVAAFECLDLPWLEVVIGQILATASSPMPTRAVNVRVPQCVDPSAGRSLWVSLSTSSTVPAGRHGLRPHPLLGEPGPPAPRDVRVHVAAACDLLIGHPVNGPQPMAQNSPRAYTTCRCGNDVQAAISSNSADCESLTANAAAVITAVLPRYFTDIPLADQQLT